ncbi:MAG: FeoB-associated Cys-rich membrane protein [Dysgonamonadaceae bacterium]|jgi:hypothetical protein|nr:FeoB-associated Cys-rich membrane protein [Dysgonamonadaceae bacterium]
MDLQLIIVIVVGIIVGAILLYKLYKFFFRKKEEHKCSGCELGRHCGLDPQSPEQRDCGSSPQ